MLIPLRHENMQGRRWPVVKFALIAINILAFLVSYPKMVEQSPQARHVKTHIAYLAAMYPDLKMPEDVHRFVAAIQTGHPKDWEKLADPNRKLLDDWDQRIRATEDGTRLQQEMDSLSEQYYPLIQKHYAYIPAYPTGISYRTANFLHGGWLHIIGNMWFLWLAGFILEDTWGRVIYPAFYLIAVVAALVFYSWFAPGSLVPLIGASGAVAALMGAFLIRFPKLKIEMMWFLFIIRVRFKAYAYCYYLSGFSPKFSTALFLGKCRQSPTGRMWEDLFSAWWRRSVFATRASNIKLTP